jgi:type II secretory pathway pseudopilin PulG
MIVVAIISILCAIAIPRFADMVSKAQEGVTKGNLGALRSALSIYYSDNAGTYPTDINSLVQKYISRIPSAYVPPHR